MNKDLLNIGLAHRAKKVLFGENLVLEGIRARNVYLVFIASDAGEVCRKNVSDKANYYGVPYRMDFNTEELSSAVGKENRKVIGITDKGFAKILEK